MATIAETRDLLTKSLTERYSTQKVAKLILDLGSPIIQGNKPLVTNLEDLASEYVETDRGVTFDNVSPATAQIVTFKTFFPTVNTHQVETVNPNTQQYVDALQALVTQGLLVLGLDSTRTASQWWQVRNKVTPGVGVSVAQFKKQLKFLTRLEGKVGTKQDVLNVRTAQLQSKSRFGYTIDATKLDDVSLAFVAYLASRANRATKFILGEQSRAFDEASTLLEGLLPADANWGEIVKVKPTKTIFSKLSSVQLTEYINVAHKQLVWLSGELETLYATNIPEQTHESMVVTRGVNSSKWNAYAGAYNTIRAGWVSAVHTAGLSKLFDEYLPGKMVRLMAADLIRWNSYFGRTVHEDTELFNALPKPWDVIKGDAVLTRQQILSVADKIGATSVVENGWVDSRTRRDDETPTVDPTLLHGIVVKNETIKSVLKKAGVFKGHATIPSHDFGLTREEEADENGNVTVTVDVDTVKLVLPSVVVTAQTADDLVNQMVKVPGVKEIVVSARAVAGFSESFVERLVFLLTEAGYSNIRLLGAPKTMGTLFQKYAPTIILG